MRFTLGITTKYIDHNPTASDEGTTPWVLTFSIPAIDQEGSPLKGYMKPARPSTLTWSRRQKLLVNPNWMHI
jgi:hypothetical protein